MYQNDNYIEDTPFIIPSLNTDAKYIAVVVVGSPHLITIVLI